MSEINSKQQIDNNENEENEESSNSLFDAQLEKKVSNYINELDTSSEEQEGHNVNKIDGVEDEIEEEAKNVQLKQQNNDQKDQDQQINIQKSKSNTEQPKSRKNSTGLVKSDGKQLLAKKHASEISNDDKRNLLKKRKLCGIVEGCDSIENYEKLNKIHEGVYGVVYRGKDKLTNQICAIKKVKIDREKEREGFPITSIREFNILLSIKHANIVGVKRVVVGPDLDKIFMIMEYCEHELKDLLEVNKYQFSQSEIKSLLKQLLEAMKYLHQRNIMHRDLKSSNILYTNQGVLKVCDFGLGRKYIGEKRGYTPTVVTLWYRAPEVLLGNDKYNKQLDVWSIGIIFAELLLRDCPIKGNGEMDQLKKIFELIGTPNELNWKGCTQFKHYKNILSWPRNDKNLLRSKFPPNMISEEGMDLLTQLLTLDPSKRITAAKALEHPWFKKFPPPQEQVLMPTFPDSNDIDRNQRKKIKKELQ